MLFGTCIATLSGLVQKVRASWGQEVTHCLKAILVKTCQSTKEIHIKRTFRQSRVSICCYYVTIYFLQCGSTVEIRAGWAGDSPIKINGWLSTFYTKGSSRSGECGICGVHYILAVLAKHMHSV